MIYRVCGSLLESNIALPELSPCSGGAAEYRFRVDDAQAQHDIEAPWFHEWRFDDGRSWLRFARTGQGYLLRFPGLADFTIAVDRRSIVCRPAPSAPPETLRHLLLDQILPLAFGRSGRLVLHASAVATPAGALAFVGRSGQGKSTLAAHMSRSGFPLITDDCLLLEMQGEQLSGTPSYPGVRLWQDSFASLFEPGQSAGDVAHYTTKQRVTFDQSDDLFCNAHQPIYRLYFPTPVAATAITAADAAITISRISPRDALIELVRFSFKLDIADAITLTSEFALASQLAQLPLFYRLSYPHEFARLPEVQEAILAHLEQH